MIGVIGGGKWGSALHFALGLNNKTCISSRSKKDLPNFVSLNEALKCKYLIFALSAQATKEWLELNYKANPKGVLIASKGIETNSGSFMNEIFSKFIPEDNLAYLSGPSFAAEILQKLPAAVVISSTNKELALKFKSFFPSFMKTYISDDVVGAEICGAYKNVLAIAGGICDGLNLGNNAKASLIARGLVEMQRFGLKFGAKEDTFLGLSGAGDLFLTASSTLSRNYRVGLQLAQNYKIGEILSNLGEVAEGVETSKSIVKLANSFGIYTPIANEVALIINGKEPKQSIKDLLS